MCVRQAYPNPKSLSKVQRHLQPGPTPPAAHPSRRKRKNVRPTRLAEPEVVKQGARRPSPLKGTALARRPPTFKVQRRSNQAQELPSLLPPPILPSPLASLYVHAHGHAHVAHGGLGHHVADEMGACASNNRNKADETSVSDYHAVCMIV